MLYSFCKRIIQLTNITVISMFLFQVLVTVSSFAIVLFLFAATDVSIAIDQCPVIAYPLSSCGVTKESDCVGDEDYVGGECACCLPKCCGGCVKSVGT